MSHPKGLYMLSTIEMWERFSYYSMMAILSLFMVSVLFFTMPFTSEVYGAYTGLVYLTPLIGGYICDRYLGNRKSIMIGGVMMALGEFTLALCASLYNPSVSLASHNFFIFTAQEIFFIIGLLLLILGNGFFKPTISSMITFLYPEDDERLDSAFTIFYMGINIGSFIAPLVMGLVVGDGHPELFKWGFLIAGIGLVLGLIIFSILKNKYLKNPKGEAIGVIPASHEEERALNEKEIDEAILKRNDHDEKSLKKEKEYLKTLNLKEKEKILDEPLTKVEKERIAVIFIIAFFAIFFWSAFQQAGVSLTFFAEQHVDKVMPVFHIFVPPEWFQSLDPLFIVLFAPIFSLIWPWLYSKGKEPSIPTKIGIGLLIL